MNLEKELQKYNKLNSDFILDNLNLIVISTDNSGEINYISPYTKKLLGFDINTELMKNWWEKTCFFKREISINKNKVTNILN